MTDAPVTISAPNPFKIGITLKGAPGYDAEWLTPTVYGSSGEETAKRVRELVQALADNGVIELVSQASVKMRESHQPTAAAAAPKRYENGRVTTKAASAPAADGDCPHGRTLREGQGGNGPWAAMFCSAPKGSQCDPLWRQKDGSFK